MICFDLSSTEKLNVWFESFIFLSLIFLSLKNFLIIVVRFWSFCSITGLLSISKSKYEPPYKSKPRFIFLFNNWFSIFKKLDDVIKIKNNEIKEIITILNFEKYNTLY